MEKYIKQLKEYMKYNKLENSLIHENFEKAFISGDFHNMYLDSKIYPILKQQIWKLMNQYQIEFSSKYIKPWIW